MGNMVHTLSNISSAKKTEKIKIYIIAHQAIYVDGLIRVISDHQNHDVIACTEPNDSCAERFAKNPADILLIEQTVIEEQLEHFPAKNLFSNFLDKFPDLRIIIFGHATQEPFVRKMVGAGARGFIDTCSTHDVLNAAIDEVYNGGYWVGRKALNQLIQNAVEMENIVEQGIRNKIDSIQDTLTKRESEVLRCVLDGMATKNIAHELCISEQSVKLYLSRMFKKFEVSNRSQLILMAFQRVCPANNMIQLFRRSLDKHRLRKGEKPLIEDPLADM
jgi:DNA-binding NarL/FixJ family response regulator